MTETLPETQPPYDFPAYTSTIKRHPNRALIAAPPTLSETTGPTFAVPWYGPNATDLSRVDGREAQGQRIIVAGRVLDEDGRPVRGTLVEVWQANAAGRYHHDGDQHDAPLDPNFVGAGQVVTDDDGGWRFLTIRPGAYPWRNTYNAWRPAHIHFSVFGPSFATRMITQMYFPGDPLLETDPVFHSIPDAAARNRLISAYDPNLSEAEYALGYRWDFIVRGRGATPVEG
ncbi:MAG: protocatechuate 3,4-dioxygenase subunit beta [Candidatus Eremiobacteraeota bacterium]|nr:protocatechuate 3,4-dioxygenase subunit beta [Candidatus Eremiobacteraeota bacterium]MBV9408369.1 protocatechuate 3,4-dioxygenase subunit beta [Candidatus Eremiobacteraeota bacterium]